MVIKHLLESLNKAIENTDIENVQELVDDIPEGVQSYNDMINYVNKTYRSLNDICPAILDILETTNFELLKSYYKIKIGNNMVYFDRAYTEDDIRIYQHGKRNIQIRLVYVNLKKPGKLSKEIYTIYTDKQSNILNPELKQKSDIQIGEVVIPFNEMVKACKTILAKLLYIAQGEFLDPVNGKSKDKEYVKELSDTEFDHDPNAYKPNIKAEICMKVKKKVRQSNLEKIFDELVKLLKNGNGNMSLEDVQKSNNEPLKQVTYASRKKPWKNTDKDYDNIFDHISPDTKFIYYKEKPIFSFDYLALKVNIYGCYLMYSDNCHDYRIGVYYNFNDNDLTTKENMFLNKTAYNWFYDYKNDDSQGAKMSEKQHVAIGILLITNILYDSKSYQNI